MLTPIDIQNHSLKTAVRGYSKKETDDFLDEILQGYEELYKENHELKDKVSSLSEGIQYYKQMETTLQKALVLAEKTSSETQEAAQAKADAITQEAQAKAEAVRKEAQAEAEALRKEIQAYSDITKSKANQELEETRNHVRKLVQSYENYRLQFKKLAESQIEMLESEHYSIFAPELSEMLDDAPNADAVMDTEHMVAINAKKSSLAENDTIEDAVNIAGTAEEEAVDAAGTAEEEAVDAAGTAEEEAVDAAGTTEEKAIDAAGMAEEEAAVSEDDKGAAEADDATVSWAAAETTESESAALQEETTENDRSEIKIPDMPITADTIVPGMDSLPKQQEEHLTDGEQAKQSKWPETTPRVADYDEIQISKSVSPASEESPFTFIDTE